MSEGSKKHASGSCKPCVFMHHVNTCMHGKECKFCHYPHKKDFHSLSQDKRRRLQKMVAAHGEKLAAAERLVAAKDGGAGAARAVAI
mmetsp:Transcript_97397/g.275978  ORF Transcript_97397/g.275978 Transcript_97397/m.275978 type:complete len:87 (-) Transcript_97397:61-321(-)